MSVSATAPAIPGNTSMPLKTRAFVIAWVVALIFYVLEYATRSSPAVMIPQLGEAFSTNAVGVGAILGAYYYTYSLTSLAAGAVLDRAGAKYGVAFGSALLGIGCLIFTISNSTEGYIGRLLQGAGSSFAFTGAVYLASRGFKPYYLATAIGVTQCLGMLGGSAGQFLVGPLLSIGIDWKAIWIFFGLVGLVLAILLIVITPSNDHAHATEKLSVAKLLIPYKIVLSNPQSYLCGLIAGLFFIPTTIGSLTWGVAFLQHDLHLPFRDAVTTASLVPLGWVFGCPLLGWISDRIGLRKPVLFLGGAVLIGAFLQFAFAPAFLPPSISLFIAGVASGAAMIPYTIIKEANPDWVKGSATGTINFLNFGVTAIIGPIFGVIFGKTLATVADPHVHLEHSFMFWISGIVIAMLLCLVLKETGHRNATT